MKIRSFIISGICLLISTLCFAQNARFITSGVIEYEKKINMFALINEQIKRYSSDDFGTKIADEYKKNNPQFKVLKSTLKFGNEQTLYTPDATGETTSGWFDFATAKQTNVIYTRPAAQTSIAQKKIYEETYLVKDSTRKINWKITNEIRNIAGYDCRRANALIMDSIYVVAFYTDEIPISGGPESFVGLPGMILGIALPYEHVTWFATSVRDEPIGDEKLKAPVKGKPTDKKKLTEILREALKDWGKNAQEYLKAFSL